MRIPHRSWRGCHVDAWQQTTRHHNSACLSQDMVPEVCFFSVTFCTKSDNGVIYCAGCLRALFWSLTLCRLHVPYFALFFVFLLVFSFFLSCCSCWDKLGRKTQASFPTRLHWCCPLHFSSIASLRIMMFVTGNIRQQLKRSTVGKMSIFPWGSKELALLFYTTSSCPCTVLGFGVPLGSMCSPGAGQLNLNVLPCRWALCWLPCLQQSQSDAIPKLMHEFEVRYLWYLSHQ